MFIVSVLIRHVMFLMLAPYKALVEVDNLVNHIH